MVIDVNDRERKALVLAIAIVALRYPGFNGAMRVLAKKFDSVEFWEELKRQNCDRVQPV
jgi:hypothetical protein